MRRAEAHHVVVSGADGPWLVLAHGIGGGPSDWDPVVSAFRDDHRVVTFAQAGSAEADPSLFSPSRHASPLGFAEDLAMLCGEIGIRGASFVGHSMAANAGAIAAAGDPGLFSRLVLLNGSPCYADRPGDGYRGGFTTQEVGDILRSVQSDYDAWAAGFGPNLMGNEDRPQLANEFVGVLKSLDPQVALTTFQAALTTDFRQVYPRVIAPTLVLQSQQDAVVPMSVARWVAAAIPSAQLVELRAGGHFPHIADPAEVIGAIRDFLGDHPA